MPFDTQETAFAWQLRLECCSLFQVLHLIKDTKVVQLEALLLTIYWPEIQRRPELLDVLSTSNIALSHRDRVKKLASAWLLMHFLIVCQSQPGRLVCAPIPCLTDCSTDISGCSFSSELYRLRACQNEGIWRAMMCAVEACHCGAMSGCCLP